jgi:hypothetical protein
VQSTPPQREAEFVSRRLDDADAPAKLAFRVAHALANVGVDLKHGLHEFRLESFAPLLGQPLNESTVTVGQGHRRRIDQADLDLDAQRRTAI